MLFKNPAWYLKYIALQWFSLQYFLKSSLKNGLWSQDASLYLHFLSAGFPAVTQGCTALPTAKTSPQNSRAQTAVLGLLSDWERGCAVTGTHQSHQDQPCLKTLCLGFKYKGFKTQLFAKCFSLEALNCQNWASYHILQGLILMAKWTFWMSWERMSPDTQSYYFGCSILCNVWNAYFIFSAWSVQECGFFSFLLVQAFRKQTED